MNDDEGIPYAPMRELFKLMSVMTEDAEKMQARIDELEQRERIARYIIKRVPNLEGAKEWLEAQPSP